MNARSIARAVQAALATVDRYDGKLDRKTRTALERGVAEAETVAAWQPPDTRPMRAAAYDAIAAGRDPATDKDVQRALFYEQLTAAREGIHGQAAVHLAATVRDNITAICAGLDSAYQTHAAAPMTQVAETLAAHGVNGPDADAGVVLRRGAAASMAWANMQAAHEAHSEIMRSLNLIVAMSGMSYSTDSVFVWADPAGLDLAAVRNLGRSPHPWLVLAAGMTLGIAAPAEAAARQNRAAEATQAGVEARARAARETFRRSHGVGVPQDAA